MSSEKPKKKVKENLLKVALYHKYPWLHDIAIGNQYLTDITKNIEYNRLIKEYYKRLDREYLSITTNKVVWKICKNVNGKIDKLVVCNQFWQVDFYQKNKIKDYKKTNLCNDKFCNNCKKVKQAARMAKYIPMLKPYGDRMYHLVLTVPNIEVSSKDLFGFELKKLIDKMKSSYAMLIRYLKCDAKIKGIDFSMFGYEGAIRSFEITFKDLVFHPHIHSAFVFNFDSKIYNKKHYRNSFSYDKYSDNIRDFNAFEILIQKIWYLLMNDTKVTLKAINELKEGYSCIIDNFTNNDYAELFKYITKSNEDVSGADQDGRVHKELLTYDQFRILFYNLHKLRQMQGYGVFYDMDFEEYNEGEVDDFYNELIEIMQKIEMPEEVWCTPQDLLDEIKKQKYLIISRKRVHKYMKQL